MDSVPLSTARSSSLPARYYVPTVEPSIDRDLDSRLAHALSRRHWRHYKRPCCACELTPVPASPLWLTNHRNDSIVGVAYECLQCSLLRPYQGFQLCQQCHDKGRDYHGHPSDHQFLSVQPPPPPPFNGPYKLSELLQMSFPGPGTPWYQSAGGRPWAWDEGALVQLASYESVVYNDSQNVLVGWWRQQRPSGVHLLVASFVPFLARLLQRVQRQREEAPSLRCCLFVGPPESAPLQGVDSEWLEISWMAANRPLTVGALMELRGGCHVSPAMARKAFQPPNKRDRVYWDWYPEALDDADAFEAPLGARLSTHQHFEHWLNWVHASLRGGGFELEAVRSEAAAHTQQLDAIVRASIALQQLDLVSNALGEFEADWEFDAALLRSWGRPHDDPALEAPLKTLRQCAGVYCAVEDVDVAAINAACEALCPAISEWRSRLAPEWSRLPEVRRRRLEPDERSKIPRVIVPGSGHCFLRSHPAPEFLPPQHQLQQRLAMTDVREVMAANWNEVVGKNRERDLLVAFLAGTDAPTSANTNLPTNRNTVRELLPALTRQLRAYQSQSQSQSESSLSLPLPLECMVMELGPDNQLDLNWRWLPYDVYRHYLHPRQPTGCLALYPKGSGEPVIYAGVGSVSEGEALLCPARFPTLADLLSFVASHSHSDTFDLPALLQLARDTGVQRASEVSARLQSVKLEWQLAFERHSRLLGPLPETLNSGMWDVDIPWESPLEDVDVRGVLSALEPYERWLDERRTAVQAAERRLITATDAVSVPLLRPLLPCLVRLQEHLRVRYPDGLIGSKQSQPDRWTAAGVLSVLDEAAYDQYSNMLRGQRWPVLDSETSVTLAARMSVFHCPAPQHQWMVIFQQLITAPENYPMLQLIMVAPAATFPKAEAFPSGEELPRVLIGCCTLAQPPTGQWPRSELEPTQTVVRITRPIPSKTETDTETERRQRQRTVFTVDVTVEQTEAWFAARGVHLSNWPQIKLMELFEAVVSKSEHRDTLFMSDAELLAVVKGSCQLDREGVARLSGLGSLLTLEDWYHRDPLDPFELPSSNSTFQRLARCIEEGDASSWHRHTEGLPPSNTHHSHWPYAAKPWFRHFDPFPSRI